MSNDKPQISKQTLDLIIVNTGLLMTIDGDSIVWYLSRYGLDVKFNVEIVRDEMLNDSCTFNRDWNNFFKSEDEEFGGNCFKSYVEKLLKLRAELREGQQTQVSTNVTV